MHDLCFRDNSNKFIAVVYHRIWRDIGARDKGQLLIVGSRNM